MPDVGVVVFPSFFPFLPFFLHYLLRQTLKFVFAVLKWVLLSLVEFDSHYQCPFVGYPFTWFLKNWKLVEFGPFTRGVESNQLHRSQVTSLILKAQKNSEEQKKGTMAEKIKVRPDCIYASNPFHECSEYCLRKTVESKMQKNKKNSGSFGFDISKSFGRKKKGSLPKPPISSFASSEVHSPISHVSPKKKTESRNVGDYTSSPKPYTKANGLKDPYLSDDRFESSELTLPSEIIITPAYQKESSKTSVSAMEDKEDEKNIKKSPQAAQIPFDDTIGESPIVSAFGSSFSFSGIAQSYEEEDPEEVESVTSESCVSVGKYRVKSSFSSILQLLFDKYGDIAATCKLESAAMRSYYLECVCYIVQELQCTPFEQLSKSKIKELMAILKDVESSKINVSWLRAILNETAEAFELGNQHRPMEAAKVNCERDIESLQKDLEAQMEDLKIKEKEVSNAKVRVEETKTRLIQLEQKSSQLNEIIRSIQSKIDSFHSRSLTSKLLQGL